MASSSKKTIYTIAFAAMVALCAYTINPANDPVYKDLDKSLKPGDDFFLYANGGWIKRNPIPPAYASWVSAMKWARKLKFALKK